MTIKSKTQQRKEMLKNKLKKNKDSDSEEDDGEDNTGADPSALRYATEEMISSNVLTKEDGEQVFSLLRRGRIQRASIKLSQLIDHRHFLV